MFGHKEIVPSCSVVLVCQMWSRSSVWSHITAHSSSPGKTRPGKASRDKERCMTGAERMLARSMSMPCTRWEVASSDRSQKKVDELGWRTLLFTGSGRIWDVLETILMPQHFRIEYIAPLFSTWHTYGQQRSGAFKSISCRNLLPMHRAQNAEW